MVISRVAPVEVQWHRDLSQLFCLGGENRAMEADVSPSKGKKNLGHFCSQRLPVRGAELAAHPSCLGMASVSPNLTTLICSQLKNW